MHPGFVVYSPETMLKLRSIAGPTIGCNYDPKPPVLARHRPDRRHPLAGRTRSSTCTPRIPRSTSRQTCLSRACWTPRATPTSGTARGSSARAEYGHGAGWWKEFASTLRMFGYDYALSIEHEDSLMSAGRRPHQGGRRFLNGIVMKRAAWRGPGGCEEAISFQLSAFS